MLVAFQQQKPIKPVIAIETMGKRHMDLLYETAPYLRHDWNGLA